MQSSREDNQKPVCCQFLTFQNTNYAVTNSYNRNAPFSRPLLPLRSTELSKALKGTTLGDVCVVTEGNIEAPTDLGNSVEPCTDSNLDLLESTVTTLRR